MFAGLQQRCTMEEENVLQAQKPIKGMSSEAKLTQNAEWFISAFSDQL